MKTLLGIEVTDEEFNMAFCEQSKGKELKVIDGKIVAVQHKATQKETAECKIIDLKRQLAETDYRAIKYAEGQYTEEEYAPYKAQRQEWRDEINELEKQLEK